MKICVVQTRPVKGDIEKNIDNHKSLIELAVSNGADIIIFPELSITGYEPELAREVATNKEDSRFDCFQKIADDKQVTIGVGAPIKNNAGVSIGLVLFQPNKARELYAKKYLHADEKPFFVSGQSTIFSIGKNPLIALAICYEISVPGHAENAFKNGANLYVASVVKSVNGIDKALITLSDIAKKYSTTVLMSNCIGLCDGEECAGKSSIWNSEGVLLAQLNGSNEGILIIDTETGDIVEKTV